MPPKELRSVELRSFDEETGVFEAYIATWNTVDSYNTRFQKGAFKKTINERLPKGNIKILWQHEVNEPIGLVTEATEDDHGALIRGTLDIGITRADQARQQMLSGTINQMSFGFDIIKKTRNKDDQVVDITEVKLYEASPVTFGANEETSVEFIRSEFDEVENNSDEPGETEEDGGGEKRATDFDDSMEEDEMRNGGYRVLNALYDTLWDIYYNNDDPETAVVSKVDAAWEKAHASYIDWLGKAVDAGYREKGVDLKVRDTGDELPENTLSAAFKAEFDGRSIEDIAKESSLKISEVTLLRRGDILPLETRLRLAEFSPAILKAHSEQRGQFVLNLFNEIREGGFTQAELTRMIALLGSQTRDEPELETDFSAVVDHIDNISKTIGGSN